MDTVHPDSAAAYRKLFHSLQSRTAVTLSFLSVRNRRGGVPEASPGDKSYAVPEYSEKFHKVGSTLPAVNFR